MASDSIGVDAVQVADVDGVVVGGAVKVELRGADRALAAEVDPDVGGAPVDKLMVPKVSPALHDGPAEDARKALGLDLVTVEHVNHVFEKSCKHSMGTM